MYIINIMNMHAELTLYRMRYSTYLLGFLVNKRTNIIVRTMTSKV